MIKEWPTRYQAESGCILHKNSLLYRVTKNYIVLVGKAHF